MIFVPCQRVIRDYGHRRLKEIKEHQQKMKYTAPDFQTKWSPTSPARYLRRCSSQQGGSFKSKKSPGLLVNISKRKSKRKKFVGAMKELAMKTTYKRDPPKSPLSADLVEDGQVDGWPVLATLAHGEVIAIKDNNLIKRKFSFPTIVEKAMEANKKGLLFCEKNKVFDSSTSVNNGVTMDLKECEILNNTDIHENEFVQKKSNKDSCDSEELNCDLSNNVNVDRCYSGPDGIAVNNNTKRYRTLNVCCGAINEKIVGYKIMTFYVININHGTIAIFILTIMHGHI